MSHSIPLAGTTATHRLSMLRPARRPAPDRLLGLSLMLLTLAAAPLAAQSGSAPPTPPAAAVPAPDPAAVPASAVAASAVPASAVPDSSAPASAALRVKVTLLPGVAAIGTGQPFDLALQFELPDGYYIYWENPGQAGMAPQVVWTLPPGFAAGPLRFPAPTYHEDAAGIALNTLTGSPILLGTLAPPQNLAPDQQVTIAADVHWLVCNQVCRVERQQFSITLPTAATARPLAAEAGGDLFAQAARALPLAEGKARYVTIKPSASVAAVERSGQFDVLLDVAIKPGFHTQSNQPGSEFLVATRVFVKPLAGLICDIPAWSEAHTRTDRVLGRISEFKGQFTARIPVTVGGPTDGPEPVLRGLLTYQACDDKNGSCFPPETVEWSLPLRSNFVRADTAPAPAAPIGTVPTATADPDAGSATGDSARAPLPAAEGGLGGLLAKWGLFGRIISGFLGGLILNIMPCVLPVISIKILSFVQQANEHPRRVFHLGLTFSAGIIVSFWVLAAAILVLQQVTQQDRGWGALFQDPRFVLGMIVVMFGFALSLFGVFEVVLPGTATTRLAGATEKEGLPGAFMKGVLATLLATPCTAPLLWPAITYALAEKGAAVVLIFTAAGLGMASPYILLTARPAWMKYLPRPGNWMIAFKQFMGFLLMGTVVWLLWVVSGLLGASGVVWTVGFLAFLALSLWLYGRMQFAAWGWGKGLTYAAAVAAVLFGGRFSLGQYTPEKAASPTAVNAGDLRALAEAVDWSAGGVPWVPFRPGLPESLAELGYTVYVDYTAKWCPTCQVNKKIVFSSDSVLSAMRAGRVIPVQADFTRFDADISADLKRFGRDAVPLNTVVPAGRPRDSIVLPVILTPGLVVETLNQAGPSQARS